VDHSAVPPPSIGAAGRLGHDDLRIEIKGRGRWTLELEAAEDAEGSSEQSI
jgi:hypothetical protein